MVKAPPQRRDSKKPFFMPRYIGATSAIGITPTLSVVVASAALAAGSISHAIGASQSGRGITCRPSSYAAAKRTNDARWQDGRARVGADVAGEVLTDGPDPVIDAAGIINQEESRIHGAKDEVLNTVA